MMSDTIALLLLGLILACVLAFGLAQDAGSQQCPATMEISR